MTREKSVQMDQERKQQQQQQADIRGQLVLNWIAEVVGETLPSDIHEALKDGKVLCNVINTLHPGTIKKFHQNPKNHALCTENIGTFFFYSFLLIFERSLFKWLC